MPEVVARRVELQTAQILELEEERVRHIIASLGLVVPRGDQKPVEPHANLFGVSDQGVEPPFVVDRGRVGRSR